MLKNKSKIITIVLLVMTVGLVAAIIYISQIITSQPQQGEVNTNLAPQKTKAADVSYQKTVALDEVTPTLVPTATAPGENEVLTPTVVANSLLALNSNDSTLSASITPTVAAETTTTLTPSPTEVVLAYNVTPLVTDSSASISATTVAKAKTLPDSGFITNSIIMFVAAGLIIFFSFMF